MKKYAAILLSFLSTLAWSQDSLKRTSMAMTSPAYQPGTYIATVCIGFVNGYKTDYAVPNTFERGNTTGFAPVYARLEYGLTDHFSAGVTASYNTLYFNSFHLHPGYGGPVRRYTADQFRVLGVGIAGYYHFTKLFHVARLDPFIGFGASINNIRNTALPEGDSTVIRRTHTITPYLKVGARYFISDKVSLFADAGYDKLSIVSVGFSCRFYGAKHAK